MSVSILLVPLAIAAAGALSSRLADGSPDVVCHVSTRMKDVQLLERALSDSDAVVTMHDGALTAQWRGVTAQFRRDSSGIWTAEFSGDVDEPRALDIVRAIDVGYGLQVQQAVLARIAERAPAAGLTLTSSTQHSDNSVTMVLSVDREVS